MSVFKLSESFKESVKNHDKDSILSSFAVLLNTDRSFEKCKADTAIEYIKANYPEFIQPNKGETFKDKTQWTEDYWTEISASLYDYFSLEKIEQLRKMSKELYPAKEKTYKVYQDESYTKGNEGGAESSKKNIPALAIVAGAVIIAAAVIIIAVMNR
ncbi:hypothetical protein [Brachyspira intermedia]|uniref:hypothetical protein n=1 Tax=Brachyspira intermedia TaxID=84377 RepID=UPI003004934E